MQNLNSNRRNSPRVMINTICPACVKEAEEEVEVAILNISKYGMQFEAPEDCFKETINQGNSLVILVQTPVGSCRWQGEVRWVKEKDGLLQWGMRFPEEFSSPSNPIAVMWRVAAEKQAKS